MESWIHRTFSESSPPLPMPYWGTRRQISQPLLASVSLLIPQKVLSGEETMGLIAILICSLGAS